MSPADTPGRHPDLRTLGAVCTALITPLVSGLHDRVMVSELDELFGRQGGVGTTAQLTTLVGRAAFDTGVANGRRVSWSLPLPGRVDGVASWWFVNCSLAAAEAESPMESEAWLAMHDGGLPPLVLQHTIIDRNGRTWRVDFASSDAMVAVEYDGFDWHSDPEALRRDRQKRAALREVGWNLLSIVADDVRRQPAEMVRLIETELARAAAA